jgi:hypothetical protein
MKTGCISAIVLMTLTSLCAAQEKIMPGQTSAATPPPTPHCDSYSMTTIPQLSFKQKGCYWRAQLFTGSAIFGAGFFSAMAMAQHTPREWPQGAQGFGYQFGTRYAQGMLKSTTTFAVGYLLHEDPRPRAPVDLDCLSHEHMPHNNGWARLGTSFLRVVWTHRDNSCTDTVAFSRIAGALASGFIQRAYLPPSTNTLGNAFKGSASALGGYAANSVWTEFQGDVFGWLGRRIPTGNIKPSTKKSTSANPPSDN